MGTIDLIWVAKKGGGGALRKERGHERFQEGEFWLNAKRNFTLNMKWVFVNQWDSHTEMGQAEAKESSVYVKHLQIPKISATNSVEKLTGDFPCCPSRPVRQGLLPALGPYDHSNRLPASRAHCRAQTWKSWQEMGGAERLTSANLSPLPQPLSTWDHQRPSPSTEGHIPVSDWLLPSIFRPKSVTSNNTVTCFGVLPTYL